MPVLAVNLDLCHYLRTVLLDRNFHNFSKIFLHLWEFPVISQMRTNFAEMPENRSSPWEPRNESQGRRGGESESLEEEAIEIGNSHRTH